MPIPAPQIDIPETDLWTTLFDRKSKHFPDSQIIYAVPDLSRSYTFLQLRDATIAFGSGLRRHFDFKKNDVLAVFAQNCIDTPAVTWGTHFAGGIVSPANPAYTVRELAHHLRDSGAKVLITQKHLLGNGLKAAKEVGIPKERVLLIGDEKENQGCRHFSEVLVGGGRPEEREKLDCKKDLAYLVYSSGTTGLPKGVMLSHLNVVSGLHMVNYLEGQIISWDKDKVLAVLPYYHIYGLQCLVHQPAFAGFTTIVMPGFDLKAFLSIIQNHKITYVYVAPPIVLHLAKNEIVSKYDISSLKTITSGAAPLTKELIYAVKKRLGTTVKQAYGLSETSPATHIQKTWDRALGSNGPPLPNQIIKFMSPDEKEVETGKEGEVWIKGPNVFQGYHNNPSATESSLTPDGFFKTGDIGYCDEEGNMYITDRVKELIKYKGFQVAPAELEGILVEHEMVEDVAVIGVHDGERETEVPVACVVGSKGVDRNRENEDVICGWLKERVAGHKQLRGGVRWVDEVPKSASGKILRRVLKDAIKGEQDAKKVRAKL
ncbi:hypothetical protein BGZ60DRAFT_409612 [Tricladium varicosporioides]|nr:hypothetical protein BGZ60DRAFT_409612 [Hymenoscyphus varicosporioides]